MSPKLFGFLSDFQKSLATVVNGAGIIPHHHQTEFTTSNKGFFDGNLIKSFLKLPISDMESVIKGLKVIVKFFVVQLFNKLKLLSSN